ncbi:hypothetical protein FRC03_010319 [Tulasnella sp. 419]|nr:hypothetical protein FRC03_010319 [Tulasnella sp. 419]
MDTDVDVWNTDTPEPAPEEPSTGSKLAGRIGQSRVYLLSESSANIHGRLAKRKHDLLDDDSAPKEVTEEAEEEGGFLAEDGHTRTNAFMLTGEPISHLATGKIFAYAAQFTDPPMGLEWINDTSVVLIYPKSSAAKASFNSLIKDATQPPNEAGLSLAHNIPLELWPPQSRINNVFRQSDPLGGVVNIRWATKDDVKKKGAAKESKFYKKYGENAGKESRQPARTERNDSRSSKRGRTSVDTGLEGETGRSSLMDRLGGKNSGDHSRSETPGDESGRGGKRSRPAVTKDDLDAELDAFLKETSPVEDTA